MKNILFIEPMGAPCNIFAKFMNIPLLGIIQLATMAKKAGYNVSILNENILGRHIYPQELKNADILCLSCITATIQRGKEIAKEYHHIRRQNHLNSHAIIGGIHASMLPSDPGSEFNQVVTGEAESVFLTILNGQNKNPLIKGTPLNDLDSIPIPDFSLLKNHEKMTIWPIMTSRGCPYHCNFCSVTKMFGRGYRTQSIERVLDELFQLKKRWIFFVDDNFAALPSRTHTLLDQLLKYRFNQNWSAQVRTDAAKDIQLVKKMYRAGCRIVFIGLESINQASLENMEKKQNTNDIIQSIRIFQNNGIQVHGMFMLGNDPDHKEIFHSTPRFCKENALSYVQYSVLTPLPGTDLYQRFEYQGRLLHKNWSYYDGLHVVFQPKNMSPLELQYGMLNSFKSFYSYSNALNDLIKIVKSYSLVPMQSFYPFVMKFLGKSVINQWLKLNKNYLQYLNELKN
ncbi:MAG TPA: radical SAM protein [Chitinispirillaceae bacterium]|nr:radical SAM protein [Chitinispirillaceae bacterium]